MLLADFARQILKEALMHEYTCNYNVSKPFNRKFKRHLGILGILGSFGIQSIPEKLEIPGILKYSVIRNNKRIRSTLNSLNTRHTEKSKVFGGSAILRILPWRLGEIGV